VSRLRARCPDCRTLTAVALGSGYECHACGAKFPAALVRVPRAWGQGGEELAAAASLPLHYPDAAVVEAPTLAEQSLAVAAALPATPIVLGGCCCAHVGAVEGLAARHGRLAVAWFDAHGDLNTPETSPSGNEWGMALRMLLDSGAVEPGDVALIGARSLDPGEEAFLAAHRVARNADALATTLGSADAVYVAFDADVLDPAEPVAVFFPEPDGLSLAAAERCLREVAALAPLAGAGFTGLRLDERNVAPLVALLRALGL